MRSLVVSLTSVGCSKVVVLGDSNTCGSYAGCVTGDTAFWPARLTALPAWPPGWLVENDGYLGMTAGDYAGTLGDGQPGSGMWRLEQLIAAHADFDSCAQPPGLHPKFVIALGTNDVAVRGATGFGVGSKVLMLYERAIQVPCVDVYVATIPPRVGIDPNLIALANVTIQMRVPADRIIPFGTEPVSDLGPGGVHMTPDGQAHRAALAFPVLFTTQ